MKNFTFAVLLVFATINAMAQYFAPMGATWHYSHREFGPETNFNKVTVIDTGIVISGKKCSKLIKSRYSCGPEIEYVSYENNIVFLLNQDTNTFDTVFNFNLHAGESWGYYTIDSVVYVPINGTLLKGLHVNGLAPYFGPILERIGGYWFLHDSGVCDPMDGGPIRCYTDSILGSHNFTTADCEIIYGLGTTDKTGTQTPHIAPNPCSSTFQVINYPSSTYTITITNLLGKVLLCAENEHEINISTLPEGIYLVQIQTKGKTTLAQKLVKTNP